MKKLRAAIMGCGRISVCYEDAFNRLSDQVELVCAIDVDEEKQRLLQINLTAITVLTGDCPPV